MKVTITETKLTKVIHKYINVSFEGFDNCHYDWAEFSCGLGVCCDPYAVGFVLPGSEYNDYLFKLVNSKYYDDDGVYPSELEGDLPELCYNSPDINNKEFDTILLSDEMYKRLKIVGFGDMVWKDSLLTIINEVFNTNAQSVLYLYE